MNNQTMMDTAYRAIPKFIPGEACGEPCGELRGDLAPVTIIGGTYDIISCSNRLEIYLRQQTVNM